LELGLAAREPSFHVFVAANPEVMIEDDIVRHAARYAEVGARRRGAPPDIVYVHDFDHPEAPRALLLPAGAGPALVQAMHAVIEKLQQEIITIGQDEELRSSSAQLGRELEAKNRDVITDLESTAKTLGFGIRAVQGGVQTFPILHGKPVSAEQFNVLDESTKRALADAEERLTSEVEKAAQLVRAQGARFQQARDAAFGRAAEALIEAGVNSLREGFSGVADEALGPYFDHVQMAMSDDWE